MRDKGTGKTKRTWVLGIALTTVGLVLLGVVWLMSGSDAETVEPVKVTVATADPSPTPVPPPAVPSPSDTADNPSDEETSGLLGSEQGDQIGQGSVGLGMGAPAEKPSTNNRAEEPAAPDTPVGATWDAFNWRRPRKDAVGSNPEVSVWGNAADGTRVWIEGGTPTTVEGKSFALLYKPQPGENTIVLMAEIDGEEKRFARTFYYVERKRLAVMLQKLGQERDVLDQLGHTRRRLESSLSDTEARISGLAGLDREMAELLATDLRRDLQKIEAMRSKIDAEIVGELREVTGRLGE